MADGAADAPPGAQLACGGLDHGFCSPADGACYCLDLWSGDACETEQNVLGSIIAGFVMLALCLALFAWGFCLGGIERAAEVAVGRAIDPLLEVQLLAVLAVCSIALRQSRQALRRSVVSVFGLRSEVARPTSPPPDPPPPPLQRTRRDFRRVKEELAVLELEAAAKAKAEAAAKAEADAKKSARFERHRKRRRFFIVLFFLAVATFVFFAALMQDFAIVIGNTFIVANGLHSAGVMAESVYGRVGAICAGLGRFLDGLLPGLGGLADWVEWVYTEAFELEVFALLDTLTEAMQVTCYGAQAPAALLGNMMVLFVILMLFESQFFFFLRVTLQTTASSWSRKLKLLGFNIVLVLFVAGSAAMCEGVLKYVIQVSATSIIYSSFFPVHESNALCDASAYSLDYTLAIVSSLLAYLLLPCAFHLVVNGFVPCWPHGSRRFEDVELPPRMEELRACCCGRGGGAGVADGGATEMVEERERRTSSNPLQWERKERRTSHVLGEEVLAANWQPEQLTLFHLLRLVYRHPLLNVLRYAYVLQWKCITAVKVTLPNCSNCSNCSN